MNSLRCKGSRRSFAARSLAGSAHVLASGGDRHRGRVAVAFVVLVVRLVLGNKLLELLQQIGLQVGSPGHVGLEHAPHVIGGAAVPVPLVQVILERVA